MKERRKVKRQRVLDSADVEAKISQYFRVFDEDNNEFLGYLMDISPKGAMLLSKCSIEKDKQLRLRVELPTEIAGADKLVLSCGSIWCEKDINPQYFRVGFVFEETPPQLADMIESIIGETQRSKSVGSK